jgi:cytochrome c
MHIALSPSLKNEIAMSRLFLSLLCFMPLNFACAAGNAEAGKARFHLCASCHQIGPNAHSGFGPQLNGIIGRVAGSSPGYQYSAAMKNSGIVWSEKKLNAFLRAPDQLVPGTRMRLWGLSDDQQIADLIAYLASVK